MHRHDRCGPLLVNFSRHTQLPCMTPPQGSGSIHSTTASLSKHLSHYISPTSHRPLFHRIGLTDEDTREWLQNLPSAAQLERRVSKLDANDLEHLLAPTYIAQVLSPQEPLSREQLERQMEWNREIYVDILGGR